MSSFDADLIVLAAGDGRRAGGPKAWRLVRGRPWLALQLQALSGMLRDPPIVVVSKSPDAAQAASLDFAPRWALNPNPDPGPFSSLALALRAHPSRTRPAFVLPVDVPAPGFGTFQVLFDTLGDSPAAVPLFEGRGGHPVLLGGRARAELAALDVQSPDARLDVWLRAQGDEIVRVEAHDPRVVMNLNTAGDFEAFR